MKKLGLGLLLVLGLASSAFAGPFTIVVSGISGEAFTLYAPGTLAGGGVNTTAGAFLVTGGTLGGFDAYCVDLKHYINVPGTFSGNTASMSDWSAGPLAGASSTAFGGAQAAWLYNNYSASAAASSAGRAALQLAIWEVLYDTGYNVAGGTGFYAAGSASTMAAANNLLASLPASGYGNSSWLQLSDNQAGNYTQDFIGKVPDGGTTLMLLGGALVGLGALRRRFRG